MFCSKCGFQNNQGEMFCKQCGTRLDNGTQQQAQPNNTNQYIQPQQSSQPDMMQQQPMNNQQYQQPQQNINPQVSNNYSNSGTLDQNSIDKAVNPNMKKWAILSVVVPAVAIIWYCFIGLSFYIAMILAAAGFGFAQKGEMANKKLAIIGKVLNGILAGMAIVMFILQLINAFNS